MDYSRFSSLGEIMEVEKVVDVVHAKTGKTYRLEAIRHVVGTAHVHYMVGYYVLNDTGLWARYHNFPWIDENSADNALHAALSYVNDRPQLGES
jgi:hypothetical protein